MRIAAVTGSASGIGAGIRARLESEGWTVVGVDLRDCEVVADLGTPEGRAAAVDGVLARVPGRLDGVVACAGIGPQVRPADAIPSVNYFGAVAVLEGLRGALAAGRAPAAVAISSNSASIAMGGNAEIAEACAAGDEARARRVAAGAHGAEAYSAAKLALARWVRRSAVAPQWAGSGIRLNAVAPGPVATPLLQGGLDDPVLGPAIRGLPVPLGGMGRPADIGAAVAFLLGEGAAFVCGSVLFVDGGTDALLFPDRI